MSEKNTNPADVPHSTTVEQGEASRAPEERNEQERPRPDPTRYGDWEKNGRCIDF